MTTYINSYKRPDNPIEQDAHLHTPPEEYDFNFVFPVRSFASDRLELRPFVPSLHAQLLLDGVKANPELLDYIPSRRRWTELNDVCHWAEESRRLPANVRYAVYSAPLDNLTAPRSEYVFAGTCTFMEANYDMMMAEVGWIVILTPFQRSHVLTHLMGLLMHHMLDGPENGGLGLRRCQWKANSMNTRSCEAAVRLGFKEEGILRALVVLPPGYKGGREGRPGVRSADCQQRDTFMASVTWYEWEENVRAHIDKRMARGGPTSAAAP